MKINYKNSKTIGIVLGIILFIALIGGITYAVFNWRSTETNITLSSQCFDIQGNSSYTVTGNNSNMLLFDENEILDTTNNTITYKNGMIYYPFNITRGNDCNTDVYYEIIANVTTLSEDYRNGSLKYKIIDDMSSFTSEQIANPLNEDLEYIHEGTITNTGSAQIYYNLVKKNTNIIPAVVFYLDGDLVPEDASNLAFSTSIEVVGNQTDTETAADYIKFLYNVAGKSTATVNSITYNLAPSVNLMNDRHASMSTDINGGDIRYYGANPNNYVWLGDTYTSTYTFRSNGATVTRNAGDKKLWRIIGVFDSKIKLISNDDVIASIWDTSPSSVNNGYGINQWGPSVYSDTGEVYTGSDLMKILNPNFDDNQDLNSSGNTILTVNNSLYWNKLSGFYYTSYGNLHGNINYTNTGLSENERNMIDTSTWYLGATEAKNLTTAGIKSIFVDSQYLSERQGTILGKQCSTGNNCNDTVVRTATWEGKVALMYPSDYGYATDLSVCQSKLNLYYAENCQSNNWLNNNNNWEYTISPCTGIDATQQYADATNVVCREANGRISWKKAAENNGYRIMRPVFYLKSNVTISSGIGSEASPYILVLSQ